jgi:hypothetical protein
MTFLRGCVGILAQFPVGHGVLEFQGPGPVRLFILTDHQPNGLFQSGYDCATW